MTGRERLFSVVRDGEVLATGLTHNEAFVWILHHQPQSVDWALKYAGYEIRDEGRTVPRQV